MGLIRGGISGRLPARKRGMSIMSQVKSGRRIHWQNVTTVLSAAVLIAAEVFGAAFAGGWAFANLFGLGDYGVYALQIIFFLLGLMVMATFVRNGMRIEPFVSSR
jgi:2-methylisocitrate lyase-like PEP mutase family enzyme